MTLAVILGSVVLALLSVLALLWSSPPPQAASIVAHEMTDKSANVFFRVLGFMGKK